MTTTWRLNNQELQALLHGPLGVSAVALERAAIAVENKAKRLCPVDTGRLRSSINHAIFQSTGGLTARVGTDVEYALDVEFGTSRARAQPFLRPALASVKGRAFSGR